MADDFNNQNPPSDQPGWASAGNNQNPYGQQPGYPQQNPYPQQPKKKSKLWLWITIAIVVPLFLCGLGVGGCAIFAAKSLTPPIDATNSFYKAAKAGDDLDPYTCKRFLDQDSSFNDIFDSEPKIDSYNFSSVDITDNEAKVQGTVTREGKEFEATIDLEKDDGKFKVCYVRES